MSDFYNKYPYTDFHELNLDWVIERVKKLTEDWLATQAEWNDTEEQWQELYNYVHDYFANLDVQDEINNKINQMILDGTFMTIVTPTINQTVVDATTTWLAAHIIQPTTPVVDNTLGIAGAAADSKTVGDIFEKCLKSSNYALDAENMHGYSDANDLDRNSVFVISFNVTSGNMVNLPLYGKDALIITINYSSVNDYAKMQIYTTIEDNPVTYVRTNRYDAVYGNVWLNWTNIRHTDSEIINLIQQYALSSFNHSVYHGNLYGITDADSVPKNSIILIASDVIASDVANLPYYGLTDALLITENSLYNQMYGAIQTMIPLKSNIPVYKRICTYRAGTPNYEWSSWYSDQDEYHYHHEENLTSQTARSTSYTLKSGTTYGIYTNNFGETVNFWCGTDTANYVSTVNYEYVEFTPSIDGPLKFYNSTGKTGPIVIDVFSGYAKAEFETAEHKYTVGPSGDYTEITACFLDLKRDNLKKLIEIDGGLYDIATEYANNNVPICPDDVEPIGHWIDYNAIVPTNSHIRGKGNVIIQYEGDPGTITYNQAYTISPLNVLGSCTIENLTVIAKNCRYCLHDDCMTNALYNKSKHIYKNITFLKKAGGTFPDLSKIGTEMCTGFGFNPYIDYEFENCTMINEDTGATFYGHNRIGIGETNSIYNAANIKHINGVFVKAAGAANCIDLDCMVSGASQRITTKFINCSINGKILSSDLHNNSGTNPNVYDITLQNSSNVTVDIKDAGNIYPVTTYSI